jgi:uncharacterized protein YbjT (DUF2867 family)
MRVVVVGASGRTGALVVKALVKAGDSVVGTIRNPKHMAALVKQGVEVAMIDLDKSPLADIEQAFKGADAVVFAAGSGEGESSAIDRKGVQRTVLAAEKAGVGRYVAVSALGASTAVPKAFDTKEMKDYYKAKQAGNKRIRDSKLKWTILEPGGLTEGKGTGKLALSEGNDIANKDIARDDVAAAVVAVLREPKSAGHTFQLIGGKTAIAEAVRSGSAKAAAEVVEPVKAKKAPAAEAKKPAKGPAARAKAPAKKAAAKKATRAPAKKTRRS